MISPLPPPSKEVDINLIIFVQRYATDLLKWDILTLFAHNPDFRASVSQIAQAIGRSLPSVQPEVGDLALLRILEKRQAVDDDTIYQLTREPYLRQMMLKFAQQVLPPSV